jgi:trimethylamine--corrinoid protein Co-methyltransferase
MLAMSYEKFIADEDLCGALKQLMKPVELSEDAFAMDLIKALGASGTT